MITRSISAHLGAQRLGPTPAQTREAPSWPGPELALGPSLVRPACGPQSPPESEVDYDMTYEVDFTTVSTVGLESSPVAPALAGLRANEARYFKNKYDHVFVVEPAGKAKKTIAWVHRILK